MGLGGDEGEVTRIADERGVREVADWLARLERPRGLAVVLAPDTMAEPPLDLDGLARRHDLDVVVLASEWLARELVRALPCAGPLLPGYARFFSAEGAAGTDELRTSYVFYDHGRPGCYAAFVEARAREFSPASRQGDSPKPAHAPAAAARVSFSAREANRVEDEEALDALAALIADGERELPVVVVTRAGGQREPYVDAAALARQVADCAFVAEVLRADLAWRLSSHLPGSAVYGGATRLFPPASRAGEASGGRYLYFAYSRADGRQASERAAADVMGLAAAGLCHAEGEGAQSRRVTAEVARVFPGAGCALCYYDGRSVLSAYVAEALRPLGVTGLAADRVFAPGMRLEGTLDTATRTLVGFSEALCQRPQDALRGYVVGMTVLARVSSVAADSCLVELFPGFAVQVLAEDVAGAQVRPSDVLSVGQVVPALVVERGEKPEDWLLSVLEADEDATAAAPPLLVGGPSWLSDEELAPRSEGAAPAVAAIPAAPAASAEAPLTDDEDEDGEAVPDDAGPKARRVIVGLSRELERGARALRDAERRADEAEARLEDAKRSLLLARRHGSDPRDPRDRRYRRPRLEFASPEGRFGYERRQMDFLVFDMWCARTVPAERAERPIPDRWGYDKGFFDTLAEVDVTLEKVLRCMVDVLLGRLAERSAHPLRTGSGGDNPARLGPAGESVWRCYVEEGTPQAARLHFMRAPGGQITFLSLRRHDDTRT